MSLRLAALDAFAATVAYRSLYRKGHDLSDCYYAQVDAQIALRDALGIDPLYAEHDGDLNLTDLLETIAESLARREDTAMLAGAILRAVGQHKAEALTTKLLAAE